MFIEIIAVYSEITAEYISTVCEQNSENYDDVANDTCRSLRCLKSENIILAPTSSFGMN
jgi:hypothetical protein